MDTLYRYHGYTLIDITKTNVLKSEPQKERNQQRNWETVSQILSLRTQLIEIKYLEPIIDDVGAYSFGVNYIGKHKIWQFEFAVEHADVYAVNSDRYSTLKDDFKVAPVILGLDETIVPPMPLFYASGPWNNIYFKTI